jgi:hypothetical protein
LTQGGSKTADAEGILREMVFFLNACRTAAARTLERIHFPNARGPAILNSFLGIRWQLPFAGRGSHVIFLNSRKGEIL